MIRISQLKLPVEHDEKMLLHKMAAALRVPETDIVEYQVVRQSLDARKKPDLYYSYTIDVSVKCSERKLVKRVNNKNVTLTKREMYVFPEGTYNMPKEPPVIVGSGPAGLFCAWMLAKHGFAPVVIERGDDADVRLKKVERFWREGILDEESNVQFGEGGAGTFSDGKLNTSVKDPKGRNLQVLKLFVDAGADSGILYQQKPHLGTDQLIRIVKNLRRQIEDMGGSFHFGWKLTDIRMDEHGVRSIQINNDRWIDTRILVCAIGHSARDTFQMLYEHGVAMSAKSFAAGIRIEHPQSMINLSQYGKEESGNLGAASYKLTHQTEEGRGVYTFCMCPGGYVVNASSEKKRLAINGMSYHSRAAENANSAVIVTVSPDDYRRFGSPDVPEPLMGIEFQRYLEQLAFERASGAVPVQLFGDFCKRKESTAFGEVLPCIKGAYQLTDVRTLFPSFMGDALEEGIRAFGKKIKGFDREDCLISGVESRSSSPVRIIRDEHLQSNIRGIYPCGEGAGYAGGITSAAMDGLKTAEAIAAETLLC